MAELWHHTWRGGSIAVAYVSNIVWLINCDPKFHFVTKAVKDKISVFLKSVNYCLIFPSSDVLQSLRKVPVKESNLSAKEQL